ncbi:MAG TPA: DMT family transporter [Candidatus Eisenbacteria bacterium]|nr:DMT family transporter [Candidatus Eisenbacteria bacterium]
MAPRLQAFLAIVFWGISFVATRLALREVSPVTLIFMRFTFGALFLHVVLAARRMPLFAPRANWPMLFAMGFVGIFVQQLVQAYALTLTTAVRTGWLIGITPIWSALLAAILLRERLGVGKIAGLVIGFVGAALVVTRGRLEAGLFALPSTQGDLLVLATTINWAIYTVMGRGTLGALGSLRATAGAMLAGYLLLAPWFLGAGGWRELGTVSADVWGAMLFLGVGCSGIAYWFWYGALERIETSRVASFLYLEPLVTLAAAVAILGEPVGWSTLVGGVVLLSGVALVQRAGKGA